MTLYQELADKITRHIERGVYPVGGRLPGVRRLGQQFGVSVSTVVQALRQLENAGLVEARPRSGYYVNQLPAQRPDPPGISHTDLKPAPVTGQALVLQLARLANRADYVQLGAAVPDAAFMPLRSFARSLGKVARGFGQRESNYTFPPGLPELQQQVARRMAIAGSVVDIDSILITNGCQEALSLALQTVAQPGDVIAIESPTFYGLLQVIEALGMKALEIPTDPQQGISLGALELALERWPVKACVLTANFGNPLGGVMPDARKARLVELTRQHGIVLIEDDIYGDLGFSGERPCSLHSLADPLDGHVIYCSSFSKTVSQGLRVGWMVLPQRYFQRAEYLKYISNLATPTLAQLALSEFLQNSGYERHLRQVQSRYARQVALFTQAIGKYFPPRTKVTHPRGGFVLWVELDGVEDTLVLSHRMLESKVIIAPGQIFSATQKYRNCIRLNCAQPWTARLEKALLELGSLCRKPV